MKVDNETEPIEEVVNELHDLNLDDVELDNTGFEILADDKEEDNNEVYTIDIDGNGKNIIYGGIRDEAEIYNYKEDKIVTRIENFEDSVIYTRFFPNGRFLIVTVDGTVALMEYDKEVSIINIGEDISVAHYAEQQNRLVIGASSGQVYLYDGELEHVNTLGGHYSEIISVDYCEKKVLSLSRENLIAHDENGRDLYTLRASEATCFKYIASDVICFAREKKVQVFKENKKLFEYVLEDSAEAVEYLNKSLILGGNFNFILLIDTTGHYAIFKLNVQANVTNIKKYDENRILFSTSEGLLGLVDIRNINSLVYYEPGIGTIFDFAIASDDVAVAGEYGYSVINLKDSNRLTLEDLLGAK